MILPETNIHNFKIYSSSSPKQTPTEFVSTGIFKLKISHGVIGERSNIKTVIATKKVIIITFAAIICAAIIFAFPLQISIRVNNILPFPEFLSSNSLFP